SSFYRRCGHSYVSPSIAPVRLRATPNSYAFWISAESGELPAEISLIHNGLTLRGVHFRGQECSIHLMGWTPNSYAFWTSAESAWTSAESVVDHAWPANEHASNSTPVEEIQMTEQEKKTPILLTETETDHVAGGNNGNHYGQIENPAWPINGGKATDAPGHTK